ncbi:MULTISPECIES: sigma-E factor negative regulatory protein [Methylibium]|uniref:Putative transmembrane sigma-E factor negative regulatory transcription regulator protein n=1 Tax=Methylibium petroleiphilum (strain ATCC BAA-1232 / LMG 22953 / PM1) TaxID=420662 RepID=A2SDG6_METPP|nr:MULTISPECIES: sigma-E factor negative regulatory protein [Methylibium]ABM93605.1 putative transmembrane sigma-E factor negative regulatory transcription regulator protein [Methylibium petroleiphilum PM1]EWS54918.1 hypothetical protein X551_02274 [Methylibium sp. T29]EWS59163.1 hypothetical protein Y694_03011 [Methylibium sp. T29-B]
MSNVENLQGAEALSALVDGEADAGTAASLSARWRDEAALRERWHSYQLIGDVLRSEELAGGGRDAAFLQRLRAQLDREPVVLAPRADRVAEESAAALPRQRAAGGGLRRWATPAAVAAGFLAVIGSLAVTRLSGPQADAPQLAQAPVVPAEAPQRVVLSAPADQVEPASGVLIRDARLDQYLAAHKQFGGSSALSVPSGFLRSATYDGATAAAR